MSNYRKNDYEDIEKIFYQDSYNKKKIGSNAFKMTGKGKRGGIRGGIQFAKHNFKKYEKNSKVQSNNIYENIVSYDTFMSLNEEIKPKILQHWITSFPKSHIYHSMDITEHKLNKLLETYLIGGVDVRLNEEQMQQAKEEVIPYNKFRKLDTDQQYELLEYYMKNKQLTARQLVENYWKGHITVGSLNSRKSLIKKDLIKKGILNEQGEFINKKKQLEVDDELLEMLDLEEDQEQNGDKEIEIIDSVGENDIEEPTGDVKESEKKDEPVKSESIGIEHVQYNKETLSFQIQNIFNGQEISFKLQSLLALLDSNSSYKVSIQIKQVEKESTPLQQQWLDMLEEINKKIK